MRFIKTIIKQVRNATTLTDQTTHGKGPNVSGIASLMINNGLNVLLTALASCVDGIVVYFGVWSGFKDKITLEYPWAFEAGSCERPVAGEAAFVEQIVAVAAGMG
jgi:hypothetical protein